MRVTVLIVVALIAVLIFAKCVDQNGKDVQKLKAANELLMEAAKR